MTTHERRPARVVLAEDDDELRRLLGSVLRKDGYDVVELRDGSQLLEYLARVMLRRQRDSVLPDLVVSDIRMPGFNGLQVLEGLRQSDWATPVLLITAFGDLETHEEARRLGAFAVFDKPFDIDDLRTAVLNLLEAR